MEPTIELHAGLSASRYLHLITGPRRRLAFNSLTLESFDVSEWELGVLRAALDGDVLAEQSGLEPMVEAGLLVRQEPEGLLALEKLANLRRARVVARHGHFGTLRLALTEKCNMACSYCFQQQMYPDLQPVLSRETLVETLDWFIEQGKGSFLTVQYFGGEPLLEWDNLVLAHEMLENARDEGIIPGFRETVTTNGTLMTAARAQWMADRDFDLTFSFDGPPEENDRYRLLRSGRGTYRLAARGLQLWTEAGGIPAILMTATQESLLAMPEYVRWFVEDSGLHPEVVGINSPQPTGDGWETGGTRLAEAIWQIWNYCNEAGVTFHGPGTFVASHLSGAGSQSDTCVDSGTESEGSWPIYVSATGARSMCVVHHRDTRVMAKKNESTFDAGLRWHNNEKPVSEVCDRCIASQICGGPCALERVLWGGRLSADRCGFMQRITELVLAEG